MKKSIKLTIFFILIISSSEIISQELKIDDESGKYTKQGIVEIKGKSKKDLYLKANQWIALRYNSTKDVVQLSDAESGKIIAKGAFSTNMYMKKGAIYHILILDFKDDKFRYTYTDLSYFSAGSGEMNFEKKGIMSKKKLIENTESYIDKAINDLTEYINNNTGTNDDW